MRDLSVANYVSYQIEGTPGGIWSSSVFTTNGWQQIITSYSLPRIEFAVTAAESSNSITQSVGRVDVEYFGTKNQANSNITYGCYDPGLTPWKMFNGVIISCTSLSKWYMIYNHP